MVKKIGPKGPGSVQSTSPITTGKTEAAKKIGSVGQVGSVRSTGRTERAEKVGRKISFAEREQLLALVESESDRLFQDSQIPTSKKKVLENAVKMAIDLSVVDEKDQRPSEEGKKRAQRVRSEGGSKN